MDTSIIDPFSNNSLFLNLPSNSNSSIIYNPEIGVYHVQDKIGGSIIYNSRFFNFKEFQQYNTQKSILDYWNLRSKEKEIKQTGSIWEPKLYIPGKTFDRIFGGNSVDIRPQGSSELIFGLKINRLDNPSLPEEQRKTTSFDFQE